MAQNDVSQLINIILDGTNYSHLAYAFQNFLHSCKLWKYITTHVTALVASDGKSSEQFAARFEEWDSDNHQIITWITNTSVPAINRLFRCFDTAKGVWDFLADRYTTTDLSRQYQPSL